MCDIMWKRIIIVCVNAAAQVKMIVLVIYGWISWAMEIIRIFVVKTSYFDWSLRRRPGTPYSWIHPESEVWRSCLRSYSQRSDPPFSVAVTYNNPIVSIVNYSILPWFPTSNLFLQFKYASFIILSTFSTPMHPKKQNDCMGQNLLDSLITFY